MVTGASLIDNKRTGFTTMVNPVPYIFNQIIC